MVNRSRVLPARLRAHRHTGGAVEILLVRDHGKGGWDALLRPARRVAAGEALDIGPGLRAKVVSGALPPHGHRRLLLETDGPLEDALDRLGHVPLPPYIRRHDRPDDRIRYQTVYAREAGSVAAPTAGLHFTDVVLDTLRRRGVLMAEVLLHVGPGTFRPVTADRIEDHRVDAEAYVLPDETAAAIALAHARGARVVAVGTTTTRVLETAARPDGTVIPGRGDTELVIVPGFRFQVVDALITNFHLPRSSLLLLVSAFAGREPVLSAYAQAIDRSYRFYSYGDAMLVD